MPASTGWTRAEGDGVVRVWATRDLVLQSPGLSLSLSVLTPGAVVGWGCRGPSHGTVQYGTYLGTVVHTQGSASNIDSSTQRAAVGLEKLGLCLGRRVRVTTIHGQITTTTTETEHHVKTTDSDAFRGPTSTSRRSARPGQVPYLQYVLSCVWGWGGPPESEAPEKL